AAARALNRPVSWVETRYENLLTMHGRSQIQYVEMGLDRQGLITGLRCRVVGDAGAYAGFGGALAVGPTYHMAQGTYRIPKLGYDVAVALTNTAPVGAFRGAGRPEAAAMREGILDIAADELDIDPVEIRRRNYLQPSEFPLTTLTGATYDSGDYEGALNRAVAIAGYQELRAEQAARRERGERRLLGIGVASYVERAGGGREHGPVAAAAGGRASRRGVSGARGTGCARRLREGRGGGTRDPAVEDPLRACRHSSGPPWRRHRGLAAAPARRQRRRKGRGGGPAAGAHAGGAAAGGGPRRHYGDGR